MVGVDAAVLKEDLQAREIGKAMDADAENAHGVSDWMGRVRSCDLRWAGCNDGDFIGMSPCLKGRTVFSAKRVQFLFRSMVVYVVEARSCPRDTSMSSFCALAWLCFCFQGQCKPKAWPCGSFKQGIWPLTEPVTSHQVFIAFQPSRLGPRGLEVGT